MFKLGLKQNRIFIVAISLVAALLATPKGVFAQYSSCDSYNEHCTTDQLCTVWMSGSRSSQSGTLPNRTRLANRGESCGCGISFTSEVEGATIPITKPLRLRNFSCDWEGIDNPMISGLSPQGEEGLGIVIDALEMTQNNAVARIEDSSRSRTCAIMLEDGLSSFPIVQHITIRVALESQAICDGDGNPLYNYALRNLERYTGLNVEAEGCGPWDTNQNCEQDDGIVIGVINLDDRDGDGIANSQDKCPDIAEGINGSHRRPKVVSSTSSGSFGVAVISAGVTFIADADGDGQEDSCDPDDDDDGVCDGDSEASYRGADGEARSCTAGPDNCKKAENSGQEDVDEDGLGDACDDDSDNDGVNDSVDNCLLISNATQDNNDSDDLGDACDDDDDNDLELDLTDNCQFIANADQDDFDLDGLGDACDTDLDGDGIFNDNDNCDALATADLRDNDEDGIGDACDDDDDNDGEPDITDNCQFVENSEQTNFDEDEFGDACDTDIDGDGIENETDNCNALATNELSDNDDDGVGDACDDDDDNDGEPDLTDNCPLVGNPGQEDEDLDGTGDACDTCPIDPLNDIDSDGICGESDLCPSSNDPSNSDGDLDGLGDICDVCPEDDTNSCMDAGPGEDGDYIPSSVDMCPDIFSTQVDTDGDGRGDECDDDIDEDGLANADDNCPNLPNGDQVDSDEDGVGDLCEGSSFTEDSDGDGIVDFLDCSPLDATSFTLLQCYGDDDGDGVPNNIEAARGSDPNNPDSDNDGILDFIDCDPTDPEIGDVTSCRGDDVFVSDPDLDGIGVGDNCPFVANADQRDTDSDGVGDNCDTEESAGSPVDTDGDGLLDNEDNCRFVANSNQLDTDEDGVGDRCQGDLDGDGVANETDNCPSIMNPDQSDRDGDGKGDFCDEDFTLSISQNSDTGGALCGLVASTGSGDTPLNLLVFLFPLAILRLRRLFSATFI